MYLQRVVNNIFNQMFQLILSIFCSIVTYALCSFLSEKVTIVELKLLLKFKIFLNIIKLLVGCILIEIGDVNHMNILIVNYIGNNVTSAIRSFVRLGHSADIAIPSKKLSLGIRKYYKSKYLGKMYIINSPTIAPEKFKNDLLKILSSNKYDSILPFGVVSTISIARIKNELSKYTNIGIADYNIVELIHDKEKLQLLLNDNGFKVPKVYEYESIEDLKNIQIKFPVVIKIRKGCGVDKGVRYAENFEELECNYKDLSSKTTLNSDIEDFFKPMIQEYIPGKIHDGLFLFNKGKLKSAMTQIREVTYPISGGVGVNNITTYEPELIKYGKEILKFVKWHGPCQVEVKKDERDGGYKLIEINPKLWGTLDLSIKAGINFALKSVEIAVNGDTEEEYNYKIGLKYKWLFPLEIYTIYQDKGNRWKRIKKLFDIFKDNVLTEFDITDLTPFIFNIINTFYNILFHREKILPKGREFH